MEDFELLFFFLFFQIADLANEDTPQLYTLCGRGPRSTLRVLRHGLEVSVEFQFNLGFIIHSYQIQYSGSPY